jgi:heme-degrading monooxygenase HmoA
MATLIVHLKAKEYTAFRKVFDEMTPARTHFGGTGHKVLQSPSDPNEITILSEWKSLEQAKVYAASNDLKEALKNAGVISQPDLSFLVEA